MFDLNGTPMNYDIHFLFLRHVYFCVASFSAKKILSETITLFNPKKDVIDPINDQRYRFECSICSYLNGGLLKIIKTVSKTNKKYCLQNISFYI